MKKIVAFAAVLVFAFSLSAQFKTGMSFRTRAEMFRLYDENSAGYDVPWSRVADLRMRPWLGYTQNEYLTAMLVLEIGDIGFGEKSKGGAIGTDGINVQTKNLFLQITPNKDNNIKVGLQPYKDFHSMLLDWDIAGISWKNKYEELTSFVGWFASLDEGETNVGGSTYSVGSTEFIADFEYQINKEIKVGINNIVQFSREPNASNENIHDTHTRLWSTPYFAGTFDKFYLEAVLGMNNIRPDQEVVLGDGNVNPDPHHTGMAFSLKTKYDVNEEVDMRFNFLFRGGDADGNRGVYSSFYGINSYYSTGLEILTERSYGLEKIDSHIFSPIKSFTQPYGNAGIILPSVFVDYDITSAVKAKMSFINSMKLCMGLGYALTAEQIQRYNDPEEPNRTRPESYIGTELNFKALIKMYDDLNVTPYFAIMFPGEWYNYEGDHDHFFTKFGLSLNTMLR